MLYDLETKSCIGIEPKTFLLFFSYSKGSNTRTKTNIKKKTDNYCPCKYVEDNDQLWKERRRCTLHLEKFMTQVGENTV